MDEYQTTDYVRFGPGPSQQMPKEWAEKMLTLWRERDPQRFGRLLAEVVTGTPNGHRPRS
jgi:hypothetical protein